VVKVVDVVVFVLVEVVVMEVRVSVSVEVVAVHVVLDVVVVVVVVVEVVGASGANIHIMTRGSARLMQMHQGMTKQIQGICLGTVTLSNWPPCPTYLHSLTCSHWPRPPPTYTRAFGCWSGTGAAHWS